MSMAKRMVFPVAGGDALVHYAILIVHEAILSYVKLQVANGSRHFRCAASEASVILLSEAAMAARTGGGETRDAFLEAAASAFDLAEPPEDVKPRRAPKRIARKAARRGARK
jgi:hypothetical protein